MGPIKKFLLDLLRRRVPSSALAYVAISWVVLQVADIIVDAFDMPEWSLRVIVVTAIVGFPFAIVFAWFFDITIHGIVRTQSLKRFEFLNSHGDVAASFNEEVYVGRMATGERNGKTVAVGVVINDLMVSRVHARLTPVARGVLIEDLGSSNGTFVNDQRVDGSVLAGHDSRVRFDVIEYSLVDHEMPDGVAGETVMNPLQQTSAGTVTRPAGTITRPAEKVPAESSTEKQQDGDPRKSADG